VKRRGRPALTPWFPGDVRPARPGVYQRQSRDYSYWDGRHWHAERPDMKTAYMLGDSNPAPILQSVSWRGRRHPA